VAFTVHEKYIGKNLNFKDLPIIPFESIEKDYPSADYTLFVPMTHKNMNQTRREIYECGKTKGYKFISYISSKATVFDNVIIGENCFVLENNTIQPFVKIGNNVVLWSGNHIGHHSVIGNHIFITSHVVISGNCTIKDYSFLGINATIRERVIIEEGTFVAMAATITKNTEPYSVYNNKPSEKLNMSSLKLRF
jgi:sugar O-acyltransferase (sialic acid O-acetyltransferase NeuD family)